MDEKETLIDKLAMAATLLLEAQKAHTEKLEQHIQQENEMYQKIMKDIHALNEKVDKAKKEV